MLTRSSLWKPATAVLDKEPTSQSGNTQAQHMGHMKTPNLLRTFATCMAFSAGVAFSQGVQTSTIYPYPPLPALPPGGGTLVDPTFGATIMRITDAKDGLRCHHSYSNRAVFNSDSTQLLFQCADKNGNGPVLIYDFDPVTFKRLGKRVVNTLAPTGSYVSWQAAMWSGVKPNILYFIDRTSNLLAYNTITQRYVLMKSFAKDIPPGSWFDRMYSGHANDNYFAFSVTKGGDVYVKHFVWKRSEDRIVWAKESTNTRKLNKSISLSKDGRYVRTTYVPAATGDVMEEVYDLTTGQKTREVLWTPAARNISHGDDGRKFFVGRTTLDNRIISKSFAGRSDEYKELLRLDQWMGTHTSMRNDDESWSITTFFDGDGTSGVAAPTVGLFHQEIIAVASDGSGRFVRLAHHRSLYHPATIPGGWGYWCTPRTAVSMDGKFIAWTSNWENQRNSDWTNFRLDVFVARIDLSALAPPKGAPRSSATPNPPPSTLPTKAWQALLGVDPAFEKVNDIASSEATAAMSLPQAPSAARPTELPTAIDWESKASACSAFLNMYRISGVADHKDTAKIIADGLLDWNGWLVKNRDPAIPYLGWGPRERQAELNCPAVTDYRADDLSSTAAALRCLLKYSEEEPDPVNTPYFQRAKAIIDNWATVDHGPDDARAPALANDGPYAAAGLRWYRKTNDPCDAGYVKSANIAMGEQLFRIYRITKDPEYLDSAIRTLNSELWDIVTHNNFAYNSYMIYTDVSDPVYTDLIVAANEQNVEHSDKGQPEDVITCKDDPNVNGSCWNGLASEGVTLSVIQLLVNDLDANTFPVANTLRDLDSTVSRIMSKYRTSRFGNSEGFDWTGSSTPGGGSSTQITAHNCAQRFSTDPVFYSECVNALENNPNLADGSILYSLVPDALFTPNLSTGAVVNAASSAPGPISPGEMITIYGSGVGPETPVGLQLTGDGMVDTKIGETRVLFDGIPAPMIYASSTQDSAVVPYAVADRAITQMQVEYRGQRWKRYPLPVASTMPGIFTADSSGKAQGVILNEDGSANSATNPAGIGSIVALLGTGVGQMDPPGLDGSAPSGALPKPVGVVSVTIGGAEAQVLSAGAAPMFVAGIVQIQCRVPKAAPSGDASIVLTVGEVSSPVGVTVAIQ